MVPLLDARSGRCIDVQHDTTDDVVELGKKRKAKPTKVKDLVQHTLSRELQLYYEKVTQAITGVCCAAIANKHHGVLSKQPPR
jgi:hypothetical protein